LTENQKTITNINQQVDKIKQQINDGNTQIKKAIEKRDNLHEKVRKAREEINQLKVERDNLNERVKLLKGQRDAVRANMAPINDEMNAIKEKIEELKKKLPPRVNHRELQKQHDAIEWKIATTSLDLKEEKELIEQVKALEIQLSGFKKIDVQYKKMKELQEHRKNFDLQADGYHKELTELAKKSQDLHAVMIDKVNAMKRDKTEADALHQEFIKTKEQNNLLYAQMRLLIAQSTGIRANIREQGMVRRKEADAKWKEEQAKRKEEQEKRAVKEKELKEKIGSQAREKLARGEEVSWDEYQLMLGDESEDDAETQA
jgi:uncharacterized coiled-coil DUF342 family protein